MEKITELIYDAKTGKQTIIERELTEQEIVERERRQNEFKWNNELMELDNWFKNNYTMYEQMLVRRKTLGIEDVIEDEFRNRVGENAYHNLIELYEEAEVVAGEIRVLKEKLKTEV